jgi:hypothetical protein
MEAQRQKSAWWVRPPREERYPLRVVDGHTVVTLDGGVRAILDTGNGNTFGCRSFKLLGKEHLPVRKWWQRLARARDLETIETIEGQSGVEFDVLLGTDVLRWAPFTVSWTERTVTFSDKTIWDTEGRSQLALGWGCPRISATILGQDALVTFDTGALLGYMDRKRLRKLGKPVGYKQDFFPAYGTFETPVWEMTIQVFGEPATVYVGRLPKRLEKQLMGFLGGWEYCVLGSDILRQFDVTFNLKGSWLTGRRRDSRVSPVALHAAPESSWWSRR